MRHAGMKCSFRSAFSKVYPNGSCLNPKSSTLKSGKKIMCHHSSSWKQHENTPWSLPFAMVKRHHHHHHSFTSHYNPIITIISHGKPLLILIVIFLAGLIDTKQAAGPPVSEEIFQIPGFESFEMPRCRTIQKELVSLIHMIS